MSRLGPNAALHVDWRGSRKSDPPYAVYFFRNRQYIRWDIDNERLFEGYPMDIEEGWPGLLGTCPGQPLSGAFHVPAWNQRIFFCFHGQTRLTTWNVLENTVDPSQVDLSEVLPSKLIADGHFAPLYVDDGAAQRVYAFRGDAYTRWTVTGSDYPTREDEGYPRKIGDGWTGGLVIAPTCAVSVRWTRRSDALADRKAYFFLGDLYMRWDVKSHTKNYKLDIPSGWKGWPEFE